MKNIIIFILLIAITGCSSPTINDSEKLKNELLRRGYTCNDTFCTNKGEKFEQKVLLNTQVFSIVFFSTYEEFQIEQKVIYNSKSKVSEYIKSMEGETFSGSFKYSYNFDTGESICSFPEFNNVCPTEASDFVNTFTNEFLDILKSAGIQD